MSDWTTDEEEARRLVGRRYAEWEEIPLAEAIEELGLGHEENVSIAEVLALIRRAKAEGAREMRERAALLYDEALEAVDVCNIRALPIETDEPTGGE